jgi:hypothetical protein
VTWQSDWHRGVRCEDRTPEGAQAAFERAAKRGHYKKCPKCAVWVEKADGCDNMKCRCGANFCYKCGSRLAKAHGAPAAALRGASAGRAPAALH